MNDSPTPMRGITKLGILLLFLGVNASLVGATREKHPDGQCNYWVADDHCSCEATDGEFRNCHVDSDCDFGPCEAG
ncbi:MAG: hypothetical protein OXI71_07760 [Gemmatimonadota bacterium]|nr:hypothetical protein [Gemmatimonadota bacterium]